MAGCGSAAATQRLPPRRPSREAAPAPAPRPSPPRYPVALAAARSDRLTPARPAVEVGGRVAAWLSRVPAVDDPTAAVTLVRFDQRRVTLALHAGSVDPGGSGWPHGDAIGKPERPRLVAAFNGGFRLSTDAGGFVAAGRVGARLYGGDASVVTYRDGSSDVGAWREGVPAPGRAIASVRQTLHPLVAGGRPAPGVTSCGESCWGAALRGRAAVARTALGVTAAGDLLWAGGERLTVTALADALVHAGAQRALELDINPDWVDGFLYQHDRGGLTPLALIPGQTGAPDKFLTPDSRDFFAVIAR